MLRRMSLKLPKEAFVALASLGWVDSRMTAVERAGLARAAKECGLAGDDLAEVERALANETKLDGFVPGDMTPWQRALTYAIGCWFARLDGIVSTEEHASLADLAKRLDLDKAVTQRASVAAFEVSVLPEGGKPEKYDFQKLTEKLKERLPNLET